MSSTRRIYAALHRSDRLIHSQINIDKPIAGYDDSARLVLCRNLWAELHAKQDATPQWFASWLRRVPNFGCSCLKDFSDYLLTNPPRYDDWYAWTVEAHDWVNAKLGKPIFL